MWREQVRAEQNRVAQMEAEMRVWCARYQTVRARLIAIMRRCGVVFVAEHMPLRLRRSAASFSFWIVPLNSTPEL